MKTLAILMLNALLIIGGLHLSSYPVHAQNSHDGPLISLKADNQPLGKVLSTITRETGYQFNLSQEWHDFPVSAAIDDLPLEQGLNRLLRNLNHTVVWEDGQTVTIMVYGKVKPGKAGSSISFASPPRPVPPEPEPEPEIEEESEIEEELEPEDEDDSEVTDDMQQNEETDDDHDDEDPAEVTE